MVSYNIRTGVKKIKTKTALIVSGATLGFAGLAMAMAIPFGAKAAVGGPVCNVPTDYATIQGAVSDLGCTTVNVVAGTYTENVTIGHALTLNGANAGTDGALARGPESIVTGSFNVTADNVKIDGFSVNGPAGGSAIIMQGANAGEVITNNVIDNEGYAVNFRTSTTTISHNKIVHGLTAFSGVEANSNPGDNLIFNHNTFSGSDAISADITVIGSSSPKTSNVSVTNNASTSGTTLIAIFNTNTVAISGNTSVGDLSSSAIYIGGANSNVAVSGNNVSSAITAVKVANSFGDGANSNVTITGNILRNNQYGVNVAVGSENSTVVANQNSITGNTIFGVFNDPASGVASLNGTCNWWGAANGPGPVGTGSGDHVSTGVTFSPWLVSSNLTGPCIGGNVATNKDQCKNDGWMTRTRADGSTFKNQGDCVSYTNNGR